tara:strand:+ start:90 stop:1328 length:1239 start_codon:yes stop_codon:yes gene_type:complete
MAKQMFTGNYGAPLAQVDTRPILAAGQAWGQAFQNIGQVASDVVEKHREKKQKEELKPQVIDTLAKMNPEWTLEELGMAAEATLKGDNLKTVAGLQQMQAQQQQMQAQKQQMEFLQATKDFKVAQERHRTEMVERSNKMGDALFDVQKDLKLGKIGAALDNLKALQEYNKLSGGPTGVAKQKFADEQTDRDIKSEQLTSVRQKRLRSEEERLVADTTAKIFAGQEPGPVSPAVLAMANMKAKLINQQFDKGVKELANMDSLIGYRAALGEAQTLSALAKMSEAGQKKYTQLNKQIKDIENESIEVIHKGKTHITTMKELMDDANSKDPKFPKQYLESARYTDTYNRWHSARLKLDQYLRGQTRLYDDGEEGEGEGEGGKDGEEKPKPIVNPSDLIGESYDPQSYFEDYDPIF